MKNIYILPLILFIISCGENIREEITEKYDNGNKKVVTKYKGKGENKIVVEKIVYDITEDTMFYYSWNESKNIYNIVSNIFEIVQQINDSTVINHIGLEFLTEFFDSELKFYHNLERLLTSEDLMKVLNNDEYNNFNVEVNYQYNFISPTNGDTSIQEHKIDYYIKDGILEFTYFNIKDLDLEKEIKRKHGYYSSNESFGKWVWFSNDGRVEYEGNFKDGERHGKWTDYNEDGSIKKVKEYKNGEVVEK